MNTKDSEENRLIQHPSLWEGLGRLSDDRPIQHPSLGEGLGRPYGLIDLPKIVDPRGNLTVAEQMKNIPFDIARVYWTYDVPSGERRGGHAHRTCEEIVIAVSGSFDVTVDDGRGGKEVFHLNHPYQGLYISTGVWRTLEDFSSGAVCLVLASELFDEDEYIYDYDEFVSYVGQSSK